MQTEISLGLSACMHVGRAMEHNKDTKIAISILKRNYCKKALIIVRDARDMLGAYGFLDTPEQPKHVFIKNATIWSSGNEGILDHTDLLIKNGKFNWCFDTCWHIAQHDFSFDF